MGLRQVETISDLTQALGGPNRELSQNLVEKQSRMIWMEGTFFILLLSLGGSLLVWFSYRDLQRNKLIQDFFSTVTHEMKTPLAGLRLQVEGLMEDLGENSPHSHLLKRAVKESDRIESQMDKAFYLASIMRSESLFLEETFLEEIQSGLQECFPRVEWRPPHKKTIPNGKGDIPGIRADKKALESILKNLIENSYKHGKAERVVLSALYQGDTAILKIDDNGSGFQGNWENLGKPFMRHASTSGTGIGIYIIRGLVDKMKGNIVFSSDEKGFHAEIHLPIWKKNL